LEQETQLKNAMITVLMPVYNAEKYVAEAVQSILDQTYKNFELLIINDGCTDDSMQIISKFSDPRIRIEQNDENVGLIATLNKGIDMVKTKYLARMDADDVSIPHRLETQLAVMEADQELGACSCWFDVILMDGSVENGGRYLQDFQDIRFRHLYLMHFIHGSSMIRMETVQVGSLNFNPHFLHAEDYDFFDRLGEASKLINIQKALYQIREHPGRVSTMYSETQNKHSAEIKTRIFKRIGVDVTQAELDVYSRFMYQNYEQVGGDKDLLKSLLDKLISVNGKTKYLAPEFLRKELAVRFLHLCHHLAQREKAMFSFLNSFEHTKIADDPKLYFSTFLRTVMSTLRN
jgi:glycosyltransferase involved in cell wall biosynthesis